METLDLTTNNARGFVGRRRRRGAGWCRNLGLPVAADTQPDGNGTQDTTLTGAIVGPAENPAARGEPQPRGRGFGGGRGAGACRNNGGTAGQGPGRGAGRGAGGGQGRRGRI